MATLAATNPTIMDAATLREPDGGTTRDIVEMLNQTNPIMEDGTFMEANGGTTHRSTVRTGIPDPTWRMFYQGVLPSKSTYAQVDEPMGQMEARGQVDEDLAKMYTDPAAFRLTEAAGHIEGMNQAFVQTLLYGAVSTSPQKFNGIMPRYASLSAPSGESIVDAGGTGSDNASILIVDWSPQTVFFIYPKGSSAGIEHVDLGLNHHARPPDGSSGEFSAFEDKWTWKCGLVVKDWRHIVRIGNLDVSNLTGQTGASALLEVMALAMDKFPTDAPVGRRVIYMPRAVRTMLRIQTMKQGNVHVQVGQEEGQRKMSFDGYPIKILDQLLKTEARVT